jgi:hypothetical protein
MSERWRDTYDNWKLDTPPEYDIDPREEREMELTEEINRMEREISALRSALDECLEYFQGEYDAWTEDGNWISNSQMKLGTMVEEVLARKFK